MTLLDLLDQPSTDRMISGLTPVSRHCSTQGAIDAQSRVLTQTLVYLELLAQHPDGLSDWQAHELMQVERSTINARRAPLVRRGIVIAVGTIKGPSGIRNTRWGLSGAAQGAKG